MADRNQTTNIRKYRKPLNLNIGMLLFVAIFFYVMICVFLSFGNTRVSPYEVREGSLAANYTYRGFAVRKEMVITSPKSGYVNYYTKEGGRVANGDLVYTIDETGRLTEYLEDAGMGENVLSANELATLRSDIVDFTQGFDEKDFLDTYHFKFNLKNTVLKLANSTIMEGITTLSGGQNLNEIVDFCYATTTGIVTYWVDGYEDFQESSVSEEIFDEKKYEVKQFLNNEIVTQGDPVYKVATDEVWYILVPIEENLGKELLAEEYVKVRFLKNQYESWGEVELIYGQDGEPYLKLIFNNSMLTFAADRFIDFEIIMHDEVGLKIPNSSIVNREFFLVPEGYITVGADGKNGVIKESYSEDGTIYSEFWETDIYSFDEETKEYYLDTDVLELGNKLIKPDGMETYTISKKASLIGVYNMNKGYADFRQINILYQNEEYAIVKSNTQYGLNVYDYIVLDAAGVSDEQFIY